MCLNAIGRGEGVTNWKHVKNDRGDLTLSTCFIMLGVMMLTAFVLLTASVMINTINIRNGVKMELNNLSAKIYADTFHSQRESDLAEYIVNLYSTPEYTRQLELSVQEGLGQKIDLDNEDYQIRNIRLAFEKTGEDQIEYTFTCDAQFYARMFGNRYSLAQREIVLTGHHNTKY